MRVLIRSWVILPLLLLPVLLQLRDLKATPNDAFLTGTFENVTGTSGIRCFTIEHHRDNYFILIDNNDDVWAGKGDEDKIAFNGGILVLVFTKRSDGQYIFYAHPENQPFNKINEQIFRPAECQL